MRGLLLALLLCAGCKDGLLYRWEVALGGSHKAQAASVTPITSLASGSSGITGVGDRYDVTCTVSGSVVLYPAVHDGSAWTVYQGLGCTLDSATIATRGTCVFGAHRTQGLTWNAFKTGAGSVSACTAAPTSNLVPVLARNGSSSSSSSSGTGLEDYREITLWLDASVAVQNNTSASLAFLDQSGKGHRFTGSSGITYLTTGGPNSKPAWSFDGSSYMEGVSLNNYGLPGGSPAVSVFAVVYLASFTGTPELIQIGTDHATALNAFQFAFWTDGGMYCSAYGGEGNERYTAASTVSATTWTLVEWIVSPGAFSGSNPVFKKNGIAVSSTRGTGADTPNIQPANIRVGANLQGTPAQFLPAGSRLAELIVMNSVNSDKISAVEAYLISKYAL